MATVWHGVINPPRMKRPREWLYADQDITLKQGDELGRFLLGSTVVMLFPPATPRSAFQFNSEWAPERTVRLGEHMAEQARHL
jgi:phosphatidylserine decarboxylase